ncbi:GmrSD restriction endonuclease domain-containing protein [Empedobacter brevis]
MSNNIETSQKLTFWQLIQNTKVEIPIIQRDYAQGRQEKKSIREKILNSFVNTIKSNEQLELDFIYGSKEKNSMQPLDGQQRLTTLFLLHWYLACKEGKLNEFKEVFYNFTYETRTSSKEFCSELINKGIDIRNLLDSDEQQNNELSKTIINASWFFLSWKKDPTIKAMLIMLDAIHQKFKTSDDAWKKLTEDSVIKFNYIELDNFGLSDDLYIKMNARGKSLTDFENFKAIFERTISEQKWEKDINNPIEKFSHKADTKWTDLLWAYRDKDNLIDNSFLKLIGTIFITQQDNKDKVQDVFNHPNEILPEDFNQTTFNYLKQVLDTYSSINLKSLKYEFPFWQYLEKDFSEFFQVIIKQAKPTYPQIVLFYAQTEFLLKNNNFENTAFTDWMRVMRNISYNSTIDSAETFIGAISLIKELSNGLDNIYSYLVNNAVSSRFASEQIKEEIQKAKIIIKSDDNKNAIHNIEDTNFCRGRISFSLYCIDYKDETTVFNYSLLNTITNIFKEYLNDDDISNDFRRGLLTIKDNQFYNYWRSWLYAVDAPKRCLIENIEDLKKIAYRNDFRNYLKEIILQLIEEDLLTLIENYVIPDLMPNWKNRLIKENGLLDYSNKHYIAISEDDNKCWLIPGTKVANTKEGKNKCKLIK